MAEEISEQKLKEMKLHEIIPVARAIIQRVVGGWIYWGTPSGTGVFVPENVSSPASIS